MDKQTPNSLVDRLRVVRKRIFPTEPSARVMLEAAKRIEKLETKLADANARAEVAEKRLREVAEKVREECWRQASLKRVSHACCCHDAIRAIDIHAIIKE